MCLAIPVRITSIDDSIAEVELNGLRTKVDITLVPEVKPGDYVIIHAGLAIQRYDEEEAIKTIMLLKELSNCIEE